MSNGTACTKRQRGLGQISTSIIERASTGIKLALVVIASLCATACGGGGGSGSSTGTPSPPPTGGTPEHSAKTIPLGAAGLAWDRAHDRLLIITGSAAPAHPNSILSLNPQTGEITQAVFVGSEPSAIAVSDDGAFAYVGLQGATFIKRLALPSLTPDLSIPLGNDQYSGPRFATSIAIAPGAPRTVAVSIGSKIQIPRGADTLVFDDAVLRVPTNGRVRSPEVVGNNIDRIVWGSDTTTLFGSGERVVGIHKLEVDSGGAWRTGGIGTNGQGSLDTSIEYAGGRIYAAHGEVYDVGAGAQVGTLPSTGPLAVDPSLGKVFVATGGSGAPLSLRSFSTTSLNSLDALSISNVAERPIRLVRWGTSGLACLTESGTVVIASGTFVTDRGAASLAASAITPPPPGVPGSVAFEYSVANIPVNDLVWDPRREVMYLAMSSTSPIAPNSIATFDPVAGALQSTTYAGSEPHILALSDNGQYLYSGLAGASFIRRFTLPGVVFDVSIPIGAGWQRAKAVEVAPGAPLTIAMLGHASIGTDKEPVVFDDVTLRSARTNAGGDSIQWGADASTLYVAEASSTAFVLSVLEVSDDAFSTKAEALSFLSGSFEFHGGIHFDSGLLFDDIGVVADPAAIQILGTYPVQRPYGGGKIMVTDAALDRTFFALRSDEKHISIESFDRDGYYLRSRISLPEEISGEPTNMIRWGRDGLALTTSLGKLLVLRGAFVTEGAVEPVGPALVAPPRSALSAQTTAINVLATDAAWDANAHLLFMAVAASSPTHGREIAALDPETNQIGGSLALPADPLAVAVSDNGSVLYAAMAGSATLQRIAIPQLTPDASLSLPVQFSGGAIRVAPGAEHTVAVSSGSELYVFNGTTRLPTLVQGSPPLGFDWGTDAKTLYATTGTMTSNELMAFDVGSTSATQTRRVFAPFVASMYASGSKLYSDLGYAVDMDSLTLVGTYPSDGLITVDSASNRAYVLHSELSRIFTPPGQAQTYELTIDEFDQASYSFIARTEVPQLYRRATRFVGMGGMRFAVVTETGEAAVVRLSH
jgi:DNA-binding beta-propeller fold protein YncE